MIMKPSFFVATALGLALSALVSCTSTTQVSLDYQERPGHVQPGHAEFTTRPFTDGRSMGPMDLGTVRTQIGTPVEVVQTHVPAAELVSNAFGYGLRSRGMLSTPSRARYIITGEVLDLYCQLIVHPYGYARIRVSVVDAGTGQILHSHDYSGERQSSFYMPGTGSPVPVLRDLTSGALQDAVDHALDDPDMRARVGAGG